ncbi:MAG: 3-dehydroquinate dehydratase [Eubacteriales bacterium]|nr:3-dehydroquinate dehydratase [Eubacteriales bacterium]MDD4390748.1 3-dehydroquinate dehydratase [Eubacteriales bacterium]
MRILVLNGPNINLLGVREPELYGSMDYLDMVKMIMDYCNEKGVEAEVRQTNHEGTLVDMIQDAIGNFEGIIINPAAYTHTSIAILDALKAVKIPTVEVHITDPDTRESFRKISFVRQACIKSVKGKGVDGYLEAIDILLTNL